MSMTMPIPAKLRKEMSDDPFYSRCCIEDKECAGRIQWHHALNYAGKRQTGLFCILPVCMWHHFRETRRDIKKRLNDIMWARATDEDKKKYPLWKPLR